MCYVSFRGAACWMMMPEVFLPKVPVAVTGSDREIAVSDDPWIR